MYKLNIKLYKRKLCYNTETSNPTPLAIIYMSQLHVNGLHVTVAIIKIHSYLKIQIL